MPIEFKGPTTLVHFYFNNLKVLDTSTVFLHKTRKRALFDSMLILDTAQNCTLYPNQNYFNVACKIARETDTCKIRTSQRNDKFFDLMRSYFLNFSRK